MDRIRFVIEDYVDQEGGWRIPNINIYINNRNLIDLISEIEQRRFPPGEERRRVSYLGHHVTQYDCFRAEMLVLHERPTSVLLTCTCMEPECSRITADVSLQSEMVFWSDIQNPFLSSKDPWARWGSENKTSAGWKPVDYSDLGVFVFRRQPYIQAVNDLARDWRIGRWPRDIPSRWSR